MGPKFQFATDKTQNEPRLPPSNYKQTLAFAPLLQAAVTIHTYMLPRLCDAKSWEMSLLQIG